MERIKQKYRELVGREPGKIFILGEGYSKKVIDDLAEHLTNFAREVHIFEFEKTDSAYKINKITDLYKKSKNSANGYSRDSVLLGSSCPVELDGALKNLKEGDRLTAICYGDKLKEIAKDVENEDKTRTHFFNILNGLYVTDGFLLARPHEVLSNDNSAAASFILQNEHGLHARPAAVFLKLASHADYSGCDVYVKNEDSVTSARSILGLMTLETSKESQLVCAAAGHNSRKCVQDLVNLVRSEKFAGY